MRLSDFQVVHVLEVLRRANRGESVREINLSPTFTFFGSNNVAFVLRDGGWIAEEYIGDEPCEPFVMHGNFNVSSWPRYRGYLTLKGKRLYQALVGLELRRELDTLTEAVAQLRNGDHSV